MSIRDCFITELDTRYVNPGFAMAKASVEKKKQNLFTRELDLKMKTKLVKCYIWIIAFFGAESWILRKVDHKYLENVEMWGCRKMEKMSCSDRVKNDKVLHRVKKEKNNTHSIKRRKANCICSILRMNRFFYLAYELNLWYLACELDFRAR
jgi:hypothetical protein